MSWEDSYVVMVRDPREDTTECYGLFPTYTKALNWAKKANANFGYESSSYAFAKRIKGKLELEGAKEWDM